MIERGRDLLPHHPQPLLPRITLGLAAKISLEELENERNGEQYRKDSAVSRIFTSSGISAPSVLKALATITEEINSKEYLRV